ncbi:hypothetical protein T11_9993 [Trichinella zimbabwensis]|uniref:Uncharacterized protein n=1 Tax=Trichinella zimbabwensis TaxID=268475 RepID=A0A0V1GSR9_9BILA|nr:hypothetical protein T11_9993 [Trichinella zimbabwensis]
MTLFSYEKNIFTILSLDITSKSGTEHALPIHSLFSSLLFECCILRSRGFTGWRRRNSWFQKVYSFFY